MYLRKYAKKLLVPVISGMMAAMMMFPAMAATGLYHDTATDTYYYYLEDGTMVTGWLQLNGNYYYMQSNGAMSLGWVQIGDDWYYMRPDSGICVIDQAIQIGDYWYYFRRDGKRLTGWLRKDDNYYYLDPSDEGRLIANTVMVIGGVSYQFAADGVCLSNVQVADAYVTTTQNQNNEQSQYQNPGSAAENTYDTSDTDNTYGRTSPIITAGRD